MNLMHVAVVAVVLCAPGLALAQKGDSAAAPGQVRNSEAPAHAGRWNITGGYDGEAAGGVNFWIDLNADGTCVDRDEYPCRWIVSGASLSVFYPDESQLGYVGTRQGEAWVGRFEGADVAGQFQMTRAQ